MSSFLTTFADAPVLRHNFTSDPEEIQASLLMTMPKGRTSLLDAIVLALTNMRNARHQRKALIIISDGGDSQYMLGYSPENSPHDGKGEDQGEADPSAWPSTP